MLFTSSILSYTPGKQKATSNTFFIFRSQYPLTNDMWLHVCCWWQDVTLGSHNPSKSCMCMKMCMPGYTYLGSTIRPSYMLLRTRYASTRNPRNRNSAISSKDGSNPLDPKTTRWNRSGKQSITDKICGK